MNRIIKVAFAALLLPCIIAAAPRMGVGARIDPVSGGFEFRIWIPTQSGAQVFVAPQAIGIYTGSSTSNYYFFNVGLRAGVMYRPENWISPYWALGVGYGSDDGERNHLGGRGVLGISVAPFKYAEDESSWLSGLAGLRFEFDSGLMYRYNQYDYSYGTFEDRDQWIFFPDFGAGFVLSW
ncbi:hypothetical protein JXM67_11030 [candidate division WOR-3 bacterium]|nr:hypothetical protein [candidate division WOR-3 bacterium]